MTLRCKPGDLATIVGPAGSRLLGGVVRTIEVAPQGCYFLPNGLSVVNQFAEPLWICESLMASGFTLRNMMGDRMQSRFGGWPDRYLRPLPGPETLVDEETADHAPAGLEFEDLTA